MFIGVGRLYRNLVVKIKIFVLLFFWCIESWFCIVWLVIEGVIVV